MFLYLGRIDAHKGLDRLFRTRLSRLSQSDPDGEVRRRAELVLKAISVEHCC